MKLMSWAVREGEETVTTTNPRGINHPIEGSGQEEAGNERRIVEWGEVVVTSVGVLTGGHESDKVLYCIPRFGWTELNGGPFRRWLLMMDILKEEKEEGARQSGGITNPSQSDHKRVEHTTYIPTYPLLTSGGVGRSG